MKDLNTRTRTTARSTLSRLLLLAVLVPLAGCGPSDAGAAAAPRLAGGTATIEGLGEQVWGALVAGDTAGLEALRLTRREHDELVWPEQPAARQPSATANLGFWWDNIQTRNGAAVDDLIRSHRGSTARLVATRCAGEPRRYETFQALTDCHLVLEDGDGSARRVRAFRHVILMDGRHKLVRYYDE